MFSLFLCWTLSAQVARRPQIVAEVPQNTITCDICQTLVTKIEEALKDKQTEEEIAKLISGYCTIFGEKVEPFCQAIATQYVPIIMQFLENKMEKLEICQKIGFCDEASLTLLPKYVAVTKGGCEMCTTVVTKIEELLKNGAVEKEIAAAISLLCKNFPFPVSTLCGVIVNKYVPTIIEWIESGVEKAEICKKLGFCDVASATLINNAPVTKGGCEMCTTVVTKIEELLKNGAVEKEIAAAISLLCKNFPFPVSTLCGVIVNKYVPTIIEWIESGVEKAEICKKLGFCDMTLEKPDNGISCTMCKTVVGQVEHLLLDQKVESEIIEALTKLCKKFPSPYDNLCINFVQTYTVQIMQLIEQGVEKAEICKKLGYCAVKFNLLPQTNAMGCTVCTTIIDEVEKIMTSTKVESEVEELVKKLCVKLPAPYSTLCDALVSQYIPQIMQWIEQGIDHLEICQKLGFCPKESIARFQTGTDGMACTICTSIVAEIEAVMENTKVESEVAELVKKLCAKFPAPYSTLCDSLVEQFVPQIMKWLEQGLEHLEICQKLKFCPVNKAIARFQTGTDGMACTVCTAVVGQVEKIIVSTKVESEIIELVKKLCVKFQSPYAELCESLANQYVPEIMQELVMGLEYLDICKKLKLCPNQKAISAARIPTEIQNGVTCDVCKDFFQWASKELETVSIDTLWFLVNSECPKVPYLKYFCQVINEQNIETIVNLLLSKIPFEKAFEFINIC